MPLFFSLEPMFTRQSEGNGYLVSNKNPKNKKQINPLYKQIPKSIDKHFIFKSSNELKHDNKIQNVSYFVQTILQTQSKKKNSKAHRSFVKRTLKIKKLIAHRSSPQKALRQT